ncbi:MAG TPA: hypothetical protein VER14_09845 [Phototrophicaceae bacterium]|nr:hypothetical protein [Phototrophicaceae bacterium]
MVNQLKARVNILRESKGIVKITDGKPNVNSNNRLETDRDVHKRKKRMVCRQTYVTDSS